MNKGLLIVCILLSLTGVAGMSAKMFMSTLTKPAGGGSKGPNLKVFDASVTELEKLKSFELRQSIVATKAGQIEAYITEIDALIQHFKARNENLNLFFKGMEAKQPFTKAGGEVIQVPAPPEFSIRYLDEIQQLSANYRGIFQVMSPDVSQQLRVSASLPNQFAQKWSKEASTLEEILPAMREYNILSALYDVFKDGGIYSLDKISILSQSSASAPGFKPGAPVSQGKTANFYQSTPVEIECRLTGEQIPEVISRIQANSRLVFQIREVKAEALVNEPKVVAPATPDDPSKAAAAKPLKNGFKLTLTLHLLEFSLKKHEADLATLKGKVEALKGGGGAE